MPLQFYPALLVKDRGSPGPVAVIFPDFPGCSTNGPTSKEAAASAVEVLAMVVAEMAEENEAVPAPSAVGIVPDWLAAEEGSEVIGYLMVPIEMPGENVRVNVTLDKGLLHRIDTRAEVEGYTRSGFLAQAAREYMSAALT